MQNKVMVSILIYCYNHEEYIKQCIDSILNQKTDFEYEIIIHDDASTDQSIQIIKEYEKKFPNKIQSYIEKTPMFITDPYAFFYKNMLPLAKGKYVALIESDDFWTDPKKIQKQFELMEEHQECSLCVHEIQLLNCNTNTVMGNVPGYRNKKKNEIIESSKILYKWIKEGAFFALNSYFLRKELIETNNVPDFVIQGKGIDFVKVLEAMNKGSILYMPDVMGVKRVYNNGSLSQKNRTVNKEKWFVEIEKINEILISFDKYSDFKFHREVSNVVMFNTIKMDYVKKGMIEIDGTVNLYTGLIVREKNKIFFSLYNKLIMVVTHSKCMYKIELILTFKRLKKRLKKLQLTNILL